MGTFAVVLILLSTAVWGLIKGWPEPASSSAAGGRSAVTGWVSISDDRATLTGEVTWGWYPNGRVCDLRLQLPVNHAVEAYQGAKTTIDRIQVGKREVVARSNDDWKTAVAPLPECVDAGDAVLFRVAFTSEASRGDVTGVGVSDVASWWGSAIPMPQHSTQSGWVSPLPVSGKGESATLDVFTVAELVVRTPDTDLLAGPGKVTLLNSSGLRKEWAVSAEAVRDVALSSGEFTSVTRGPEGCKVSAFAPKGAGRNLVESIASSGSQALSVLVKKFGRCPHGSLKVVAGASGYSGMEYPGVVFVSLHDPAKQPRLIAHEVAHQFFYSLVGNDQGRHPWLDEAFATYGEALVNPASARSLLQRSYPSAAEGRVGAPVTHFKGHGTAYSSAVYSRGASLLLKTRQEVGAQKFDAAIRSWVASCAEKVCGPSALKTALNEHAPASVALLRQGGAFTR